MTLDKIVVVKKATPLEELLRRYSTTSQVKFVLESRGQSFDFYKEAHEVYQQGLKQTIASIPRGMRSQIVDKEDLSTFQFGKSDLVVAVGGDGMVVNVAKYVGEQPLISLNPDEERNDGVLACCNPQTFSSILYGALEDKAEIEKVTMAEVRLDDGQVLYALNDFFIGRNSHVSARYEIEICGERERHSSDGIIVSTGTGSTGWMTSIAGSIKDADPYDVPFDRTEDRLLFAVRNPFPSKITGTTLTYGDVYVMDPLIIRSQMPERGVIFSDGIEDDYLEFNAGATATIIPSEKKVYLVKGGVE